ncbi:MAG: tRNA pseudouridine(55) synthase TruB [Clostridia bacterium]|nr:tRNA pseudouridine(55) synthase TruB [Clostridia bacterium]
MNGFVIVDKEEGITSFKASSCLRRIYNEKKTGHTGTLDPMATGVLPVAMGRATRFIDLLPDSSKAYIARFKFGIVTDTLDITGTVLEEKKAEVTKEQLESILPLFRGDIMQMPPMYSALSVNGVKLYKLARQGVEVEREQRQITINSLELTNCFENGEFEISVDCSKGTYIRSLIADIGERLGCGAVMTALRRTKSNGFTISQAKTLSEIEKAGESAVLPIDEVFGIYPSVTVSTAQAQRFSNGGELMSDRLKTDIIAAIYRVYSPEKEFLGLGEITAEDMSVLKVKKVVGK